MKYTTIRIEGAILSADILAKIEQGEMPGQAANDFGFGSNVKVKDEIARAWADAQDMWRVYSRRMERVAEDEYGTSETRKFWIIPLLEMLGYDTVLAKAETVDDKSYAISHRAQNLDGFPIHIMGFRDNLDKKRSDSGPRMSPHALVQEYINLKEHLYAIVSNGTSLRLLRDSSRLIKLSFIEFDLASMMDDDHFTDFAIMYRLLHATRMPRAMEQGGECLIEQYHQDALDSGSRIRDGLSRAVEFSIRHLADGFLAHSQNDALRQAIVEQQVTAYSLYDYLLKLIYRLLFLMVIEERDLVFPKDGDKRKRDIYYSFYSVQSLRLLSEKPHLADSRFSDQWLALKNCFQLFENEIKGAKLGLKPLAGDLFGYRAIGILNDCCLDNEVLLTSLRNLSMFTNPVSGQKMRVNYGSLNVEEFGSVYEGLLEKDPVIHGAGPYRFDFKSGSGRSISGSHYTPDELVQPLIKHSLDYIIADRLKEKDPISALLSIKVCDVSCGSGHILLNAARRIGVEIAKLRTGEDQPSPEPFRQGVRDAIANCIYGVDKNPLAVELCKVALWLEAHNPGKPLSFLDHHIKCGDAIVGFARREEMERGVPDEAFATMPGDDNEVAAELRKRNKKERKEKDQTRLEDISPEIQKQLDAILAGWREVASLPERSPGEIEAKKQHYQEFSQSQEAWLLNQIAAIPIAQFYLKKTEENLTRAVTDLEYRRYLSGHYRPQGSATATAWALAHENRFFHWFLEFPEIIGKGGFDCILGNPPYLHGQKMSGTYGHPFCSYLKWEYAPAGLSDLVVYFVRRIYSLLRPEGFTAFITTNSIKDGDIRKDGLEQILKKKGEINFVVRGIKWPGQANLVVSLVAIHKGEWQGKKVLDGKVVPVINAFFEDRPDTAEPKPLSENAAQIYQGSIFLGDGFLLPHEEARVLIAKDHNLRGVIFSTINGKELNNNPDQNPGKSAINFFDWPLEKASTFGEAFDRVHKLVKPVREKDKRATRRERWWQYAEKAIGLYNGLGGIERCFVAAITTKHLNFSALSTDMVFTNALYVFTTDRWDLYSVVQSTLHEVWARKYSGTLKQDLRYSPSDCFETFPFPEGLWTHPSQKLTEAGEQYHEYRRKLMLQLWLGLTSIYNLFHERDLTSEKVAKVSKKSPEEAEAGYQSILELRRLHRQLDNTVLDAYGWTDLDLAHDFYEIETLPENDRLRYSISPEARKELLKHLLALNHQRAAEQVASAPATPSKSRGKKIKNPAQGELFG